MHRKDLVKEGYKSIDTCSGTKRLQTKGKFWKAQGKIKSYRIVPYGGRYELYIKR